MTGHHRVVPVREGSIRLGQLLKLADLVDAGSDAKPLLADGLVSVNGAVETRRGRRLVVGDVVTVRHARTPGAPGTPGETTVEIA